MQGYDREHQRRSFPLHSVFIYRMNKRKSSFQIKLLCLSFTADFSSSKLSKSAISPILNHDQTYHPSFITRTKEKYKCFVSNFRQSMMLISLSGSIWWSIHIAGDILTGGVGPAQKHGILQAWISDYKSVFVISEWDSIYQFKLEYTTGLSAPGKIISSSPFCACLLVHNVCGSSK